MSAEVETDGATFVIGDECSVNGRARVSVEVVMTEEEREQMLQSFLDDSVVYEREDVIEALNLAEPETAEAA
jgi:hypothetical protein